MVNHQLHYARGDNVKCLRCKKHFVKPKIYHDLFDTLHCVACNDYDVKESLRQIEELESKYKKAPLKRQRRQRYIKISKTF